MKIQTSKSLPSAAELIEILKREFSAHYSYTLFGLGKKKTVLVGKSALIGVQISIDEKEITIQNTPPSWPAFFVNVIAFTEFAFLLLALIGLNFPDKMKSLERDVAIFLQHKYNH